MTESIEQHTHSLTPGQSSDEELRDVFIDFIVNGDEKGYVEYTDAGVWVTNKFVYLIDAYVAQQIVQAKKDVWTEIRNREGMFVNKDGCIEIHPDYIDERIAQLNQEDKL